MKKYNNRKEAIREIRKKHNGSFFISSVGLVSRELYHCADSPKNFYMMGSMGCALPFAIGIALNKKRDIVVIAGDGEILMNMGSLVLLNQLRKEGHLTGTIHLYIFCDGKYEATGGQRNCSPYVNFEKICDCESVKYGESKRPGRIPVGHRFIYERFRREIN